MIHVEPDQGEHVAGGITEEENNTIRKWKGRMVASRLSPLEEVGTVKAP